MSNHIKTYYGYIVNSSIFQKIFPDTQSSGLSKYRLVFFEFPELVIEIKSLAMGDQLAKSSLSTYIGKLIREGRLIPEPQQLKDNCGVAIMVEISVPYIRERWCFPNCN